MRRPLRSRARRRAALVLIGLLVVLVGSGCQVSTQVAVVDQADGAGTVTVTVTLDRAADAAVGGLATQLDTAGLAAQGWVVGAVAGTPGGGASVEAQHAFSTPAQLSAVLAGIAGSGGHPAFGMAVARTRGLWQDHTSLRGRVDLSCGVDCFGDAALGRATGSAVGIDPATAAAQAGVPPAGALHFALSVRLPGDVTSTDAASRAAGVLRWDPRLGQVVVLDAATRSWNTTPIVVAAAAGAVVLVAVVVALVLVWRRHRRRPVGAHGSRGGAPAA